VPWLAALVASLSAPLRLEISTALGPEISWPVSSGIRQKKNATPSIRADHEEGRREHVTCAAHESSALASLPLSRSEECFSVWPLHT
jgi:hypothetical protein